MPKKINIPPPLPEEVIIGASKFRSLLEAEEEAQKFWRLGQLHPMLVSEPVIGFEQQLITEFRLNYSRFLRAGSLTRDVLNCGNHDARICAVATALQFVSREDLASPEFFRLVILLDLTDTCANLVNRKS